MLTAARSNRATAIVRDFAVDQNCGPRIKPRVGSLGALEPEEALACCQGATLAWAVGNLPGTRLFLVGGSLMAAR